MAKRVWQDILAQMAVQDLGSPSDNMHPPETAPVASLPSETLFPDHDDVDHNVNVDPVDEGDYAQSIDETLGATQATVPGVSSRTGMTNQALAQLGKEIGGRINSARVKYVTPQAPQDAFISETARKRQKLDRVISNLENDSNNSDIALMIMSQNQRWEQEREERREDRRENITNFIMFCKFSKKYIKTPTS